MTLEKIGEKELIQEIQKIIGKPGERTPLGIGDDAAIIEPSGKKMVITTDAFTEWVHFRMDHIAPDQLGAKVMAATVSDCAAMGCAPRWVTVAIAAPEETPVNRVMGIYHGLVRAARLYGCDLVGGDTIRSFSDLSLTLTAVGEPFGDRIITRSTARVGDDLYVSGQLGGAMAGFILLDRSPELSLEKKYSPSMMRYLAPEARVELSRLVTAHLPVTAMIDVSDGLSVELHHLRRESGVGFHINPGDLPVLPSAIEVASDLDVPLEALVFQGGEEFELLFTVSPDYGDEVIDTIQREAAIEVTRIGTVVPEEEGILLLDPDGTGIPLTEEGFEHFGGEKPADPGPQPIDM